jgi:hypothetical protein
MLPAFKVLLACWLVLLSTASMPARSPYPLYLKGITTIEYRSYVESRASPGQRCVINRHTWNTALEVITAQSKLKFISEEEYRAQLDVLREEVSSLRKQPTSESAVKALDAAQADLEEYGQMPTLSLVVAGMEYFGRCAAVFRASLHVHVTPTDFIGTKEIITLHYIGPGKFNPVIQIWHGDQTLQTRDKDFAAQVISTAATTIKTLVDELTEAQKCESC